MKKKSRFIILFLSALLVMSFPLISFADNSVPGFDDVPNDAWYFDDVYKAVEKGFFNGTSDTTFSPEQLMTRGMFVTVLYRQAGSPQVSSPCRFSDVNKNEYYTKAITWASENGIVDGYPEGTFGPDNEVTREAGAKILCNYCCLRHPGYSEEISSKGYDIIFLRLKGFDDLGMLSDWAVPHMAWANDMGLINGRADGNALHLAPLGKLTRAEACSILNRYVEKEKGFVVDNTGTQAKDFVNMTNAEVIETVGPLFTADQRKSGVLASVSLAQFILESGYGKSELAVNANNCFGMKTILSGNTWSGSSWDGTSIYTKVTHEQNPDGSIYYISADFRSYKCVEDSIADHSAYLLGAMNGENLRYAGLKGCTDYRQAIQIIKDGGYATSLTYVDKICSIIENWNLTQYDATSDSDIDLRIDKGSIHDLQLGGLAADLEEAFGMPVDLVPTGSLDNSFLKAISEDEVLLYEAS